MLKITIILFLLNLGSNSFAEEAISEKVETNSNKAIKEVKKTYRKIELKACETVNSKMECVGKRIKNVTNNIKDDIDSRRTEMPKKNNN